LILNLRLDKSFIYHFYYSSVALLEQPLVLEEGRKRERRKVENFEVATPEADVKLFEIKDGKGRSLGDIPYSKSNP